MIDEVVIYSGKPVEGDFYDDNSFHRWVSGDPLRAHQKNVYFQDGSGSVIKEMALPQSDVTVVCEYPPQPEGEPSCGAQRSMRITLKGPPERIGEVERIIKTAEREASKKQEVVATSTS